MLATTRTAVVTGASSGIGAAAARSLHASGLTVYAAARRVDRMEPLARDGIRTAAVDVTDNASMVSLVDRVVQEAGRIDALVNNAGYGSYGALEDVPLAEGRRQFEVNVFGAARMTQLVVPHMRRQRSGRIVNVSSIGGKIYEPMGSWYHASKFALEGMSDSLRLELAPFGIEVVVIEPGVIATEWGPIAAEGLLEVSGSGAYAQQAREGAELLRAMQAPGRASPPEVIAATIATAVTSRRPKLRYVAGRGATPLLLARRLLPDRAFDRLLRYSFRAART